MKLTRQSLRKIILREVKLIKEGSVSELIIEMAEIIEEHMDTTGRNRISLRDALRLLRVRHPLAAEFERDDLEEFVRDCLIEGQMDFADLGIDVMVTPTGREIEVVVRHVDNDEDQDFESF